jgi:hypothetical protein
MCNNNKTRERTLDLHFSLPLMSHVGMTVKKYVYMAHNFETKKPTATVIRRYIRRLGRRAICMFPAVKQRIGGHKFKDYRDMKTLRPTTQTTIDVQQKNSSHDMTGGLVMSGVIVKVVGYQRS